MLKQHHHFMLVGLIVADACAISLAWVLSFWVRFTFLFVDPGKGVPDLRLYLAVLPLIVGAHLFIFYRAKLYRPRRDGTILGETRDIVTAFFAAVVAVILIDYALPQSNKISRQFVLTYAVIGTTLFALFRGTVRAGLRVMRRRGHNHRVAAIVGTGRAAQRLLHALRNNSWIGMDVAYFVDEDAADGREVRGIPVLGPLAEFKRIINDRPVDAVFVALPANLANRTDELLAVLEDSMVDVRLVPQLNPTYTLRPNLSRLDGVPILALRQTPLYGWNAIQKRGFDVIVGAICLAIGAAPMALIAIWIKLADRGPALYRQRRVGLDGCEFEMVKFRTMRIDAEADGAVWSRREDQRRTRLGSFLRRTSLDELPNLFNVLRGQMSLVGPRPERPEFINQFREEIPRYMLRHKIKAGMTGFAQIKGYRGDTSLKKRIQHDVHYINNWSLALDLRILLQTVFGVWFSKHEA